MSTWQEQSRNTASYTNESKSSSIWDVEGTGLLLLESGFLLILESAIATDRLLLEQTGSISSEIWVNETKN